MGNGQWGVDEDIGKPDIYHDLLGLVGGFNYPIKKIRVKKGSSLTPILL
jgi:hypothetical protein